MDLKRNNRRSFLKWGFLSLCSLPFLKSLKAADQKKDKAANESCPAKGPEGKKLIDPKSKAAQRLDFVMDAKMAAKHKKYKKGDTCKTCRYYLVKKEAGGWAPCQMLGAKYVPNCAWCKTFKLDPKRKA